MIRFIITAIEFVVFTVLLIPWVLAALVVRIFDRKRSGSMVQAALRLEFRVVIFLTGSPVEVKGLENIPGETCLFVSNHRGCFDIILAYAYTKKPTGFISKMEWKRIPVLAQVISLTNGLFLDREDLRQGLKTILAAIEEIKEGISIWICPEGTRAKEGDETEMLPFHEGSFKIAKKTGAPVVPVVFKGTREVFEANKPGFRFRSHPMTVYYGKPLDMEEMAAGHKQVGEYVRELMIEMVKE